MAFFNLKGAAAPAMYGSILACSLDAAGFTDTEEDSGNGGEESQGVETLPEAGPGRSAVLFAGTPRFAGGEAVLFDSAAAPGQVPERATIDRLQVRFPDGAPDPASLDPGLCLLIFVDDLASPRARARLADVVRQRGERPLNLLRLPGQVVRLVLVDPAGAWAKAAPRLEVALGW